MFFLQGLQDLRTFLIIILNCKFLIGVSQSLGYAALLAKNS